MEKSSPSPLLIFGAIAAAFGACLAVWVAAISKRLICESSCRTSLMDAQLLVALIGIIPIGLLLFAAIRGRRRLALSSLIAAVIIYLGWGVLNDAAVHGWQHLRIF